MKKIVSVMMGSDSDKEILAETVKTLEEFNVAYDWRILSAHRSPDLVKTYVRQSEAQGIQVFIAAAGGAAHLAGTVAALTSRPVLGIPVPGGSLGGMDALLSTVQMPSGIPVATFAIGKAGAKNAALAAIQILALNDSALHQKMVAYKNRLGESVIEKDKKLQEQIQQGG